MKAAIAGKADVVSMLVEKGANVNFGTVFADTPLLKAAAAGQAPTVSKLIHLGAEVDHANMAGAMNVAFDIPAVFICLYGLSLSEIAKWGSCIPNAL
jgi:ankyrin repeat protein